MYGVTRWSAEPVSDVLRTRIHFDSHNQISTSIHLGTKKIRERPNAGVDTQRMDAHLQDGCVWLSFE